MKFKTGGKRILEGGFESSALKRLRTIEEPNGKSNLVVRVGSLNFNVRLLPLLQESLYFMRRIDDMASSLAGKEGSSPLVIQVPTNSPCTPDAFRIVINYCYHQMEDSEISCANVVELIATCEFLEMRNLKCKAWKSLDEYLKSWHECLCVLSTFDSNNLPQKKDGDFVEDAHRDTMNLQRKNLDENAYFHSLFVHVFEKCKSAFLENMDKSTYRYRSIERFTSPSCNLSCLLQVAERLPLDTAKHIYASLLVERFGLCYMKDSVPLNLISHNPSPTLYKSGVSIRYYPKFRSSLDREFVIAAFKEFLRTVSISVSRRSLLLLYLAKLARPEKDGIGNTTYICLDFLCAILSGATELLAISQDHGLERGLLEVEIGFLELFVAKFFRAGFTVEIPAIFSRRHRIQSLLAQFNFPTMLSIVKYWGILLDDERPIVVNERKRVKETSMWIFGSLDDVDDGYRLSGVARILDTCLSAHLHKKSFTIEEVLEIYKEFPNRGRASRTEIYLMLKDCVTRSAVSVEHMDKLSNMYDYNKLEDEVVERLWRDFGFGCSWNDPLLQERLIRMQQKRELMTRLRCKVLEMQRQELCTLRRELTEKASEAETLLQEKKQVESKLDKEIDKNSCGICLSRRRNAILLPCNHFHYCVKCIKAHFLQNKTKECPTCRGLTTSFLKCHV